MGQLVSSAIAGPVWGILATRKILDRRIILTICTVAQGIATGTMWYFMKNVPMQLVLRCINGMRLAGLRPIANSIVGDRFDDTTRGQYFGIIMMALQASTATVSILVTVTSEWCLWGPQRLENCPEQPADCNSETPECTCGGLWGWQMSFITVGVLTALLGPVLLKLLNAPPVAESDGGKASSGGVSGEFWALVALLKRCTFCVLVFQGCFGLIPWKAFDFRTFFFETAGLGKTEAATVNSSGGFAAAAGSAIGGWIGDTLNRCWPLHGRVLAAEISVYGGIPFAYFTFYATTPAEEWAFIYYLSLTVGLGLVASWTPGACNNPILSSLAAPNERALILSWQASLEGAIGALGSVIFTQLIAIMGYDPCCNNQCNTCDNPCGDADQNKQIAGLALVLTSCIPWLICGGLYSCLHCTYPGDLRNIETMRMQKAGLGTELADAS